MNENFSPYNQMSFDMNRNMRGFHNLDDFEDMQMPRMNYRMPENMHQTMASPQMMPPQVRTPNTPGQSMPQMPSGTKFGNTKLDELPIAMAYVPMQKWQDIYDVDVGFERATIFAQLDKPFLGRRPLDD